MAGEELPEVQPSLTSRRHPHSCSYDENTEEKPKANEPKYSNAHVKNRRRYMRACRQLGTPPLSRLMKQLGKVIIDMSCEGLTDNDVNALCAALLNHNNLDILDLNGNVLQPQSLSYLGKLMNKHIAITELNISDNRLGRGNNTRNGVSLLRQLTKHHKCLQKLNISGNKITDDDAADVASLIKESPALWELNLSHNELREKGGMFVGEAMSKNDTMYTLDLSWNHLRGRGAECVALGLMNNSNLTKLNVGWNGFGFEGCVATACSLRKNTSLTELDMSSNRIHMAGVWELWKGLMENKTLRTLKLGANPLQVMCTTPLICKIRDNPYMDLATLDLSGITVDKEFEVVLDEIKETRPDFEAIYDKALPIHKQKWDDFLNNKGQAVFNVDPVRILFYAKKNLRVIDMFNKMDVDGDARLTKKEIHKALKMENFDMSATAIDTIFEFLDEDGDGKIDLAELYHGERRMKRKVLGEAKAQSEREKLDVERGDDIQGLRGDLGGLGGRFSKTYRPDLAQGVDPNMTDTSPRLQGKKTKSPLPPIKRS